MGIRRHLQCLSAYLALVLLMPVALAQQGDRGRSESSGSVIGYQPIPSSALPTSSASASAASVTPIMGTQTYAMNPAQGMPQAPMMPQAGTVPTPRGSGYDYTIYLVGQGPYTLGRDDVIRIEVRNQPDFTGEFVIGPDGSIQYNYLGDIPVLGMTKYEVQQIIEKLLERYIRVPQVSVIILAYNSKAVYMIGELNRPGKYIMRGDTIKLREAVVAAGLPTRTAALWRTHIVYPDINNPRIRKVNLKKILYKGKLQEDIDLFPGEIVVVPSTVLNSVNLFLSDLLNPFTRAASAAAIGAGI